MARRKSLLFVCFGEMLIDFVPTTCRLSLAQSPAFKKATWGSLADVAIAYRYHSCWWFISFHWEGETKPVFHVLILKTVFFFLEAM